MDIVKRLREGKSAGGYWREKEAADEIERLREAFLEIVYQIGQGNYVAAMDIAVPIAAAALQQKESK